MSDQIVSIVLDESKWLTISMCLALAVVATLLFKQFRSDSSAKFRVLIALNVFFSVVIGTMAFGHLLAVTIKLFLRSLEGSTLLFYLIGIALAIPSWWLFQHTVRVFSSDNAPGRMIIVLNTWTAITLLALGLHNLPLAAPSVLNIGYQLK